MRLSVHLQQRHSSYLSSSVCWTRTCWAAARAPSPCCKLFWQESGPEPPGGGCGWGWYSAERTCPAPCPCPGASTGGKGGWKAGEVCCFLPKVVLPLRRVWSECLLEELQQTDSRDGVIEGQTDQNATNQIEDRELSWAQSTDKCYWSGYGKQIHNKIKYNTLLKPKWFTKNWRWRWLLWARGRLTNEHVQKIMVRRGCITCLYVPRRCLFPPYSEASSSQSFRSRSPRDCCGWMSVRASQTCRTH